MRLHKLYYEIDVSVLIDAGDLGKNIVKMIYLYIKESVGNHGKQV